MTLQIEPRHDLSPNEIDAIEDRIYDHNSYATGRHDGQGVGFVIRNEVGQMIGVAARMAEFEGWPEGHTNVVLCKTLPSREN